MKKVLYVATVVKTHIMEFHIPYLKWLKEKGWETAVAARNDYEHREDCVIPYCDSFFDLPFERNPIRTANYRVYIQLKKIIDEGGYDVIHCHTPVGALLTRFAARKARKRGTKVIYTAHGFHFYQGAPIKNWLFYYPIEKMLAKETDILITVNKEDYLLAKKFKAGKVLFIPGVGIDVPKFRDVEVDQGEKRRELNLSDSDFVLLSVGELITRKNHKIVLEALGKLKESGNIGNIRYLICGNGPLEKSLRKLAAELGIEENVRFLGYRNDINEICKVSDLFVFMSLQEGLPVALMEAMASGLPVICSAIRGNTDLVQSGFNGILCDMNADRIAEKVSSLMNSKEERAKISANAIKGMDKYDLKVVMKEMQKVYKMDL